MNPADVWAGKWKTNYGVLVLTANGRKVTGNYSASGHVEGLYDPHSGVLSGTFTNNNRKGRFTFLLDGERFSGKWKYDGDTGWRGDWNGTKMGK